MKEVPKEENACGSDVALLVLNEAPPAGEACLAQPFTISSSPAPPFGSLSDFPLLRIPKVGLVKVEDMIKNEDIYGAAGSTSPDGKHEGVGACDGIDSHMIEA